MASKDNISSATGNAPSAGTGESNQNDAPVVLNSAPPSKKEPVEYEKGKTDDGQEVYLVPLNDTVNLQVPVKEMGKTDLPTPYVKFETVG